jgi:hypothetical protein
MTQQRSYVDEVVRTALAGTLHTLLQECTEPQQAMFARIYPSGVPSMSEQDLRRALGLVKRTVDANRKR